MCVDHINKYIFNEASHTMFCFGRVAAPLFMFVFAYNLARPGALENKRIKSLIRRLLITGTIASVPFIALGDLSWGWYPLNILFTLLVSAIAIKLLHDQRFFVSITMVLLGGAFVEFWWMAIIFCICVWRYCVEPRPLLLLCAFVALGSFALVNGNSWALVALPIIICAQYVTLKIPRIRYFFYVFYPAHLAMILLVSCLLLIKA